MEYIQDLLCGKTSSERSAATKARTSEPYSKNLSKSSNRQPLCLRFRRTDGPMPTVIAVTDGALLTEFLTRNTSERLRDEEGYTLSSILQENVPQKYYLSAKACAGILRRAERRGKELPPMLKAALMSMMRAETETAAAGMSGNNQPVICMATGQANAEKLVNQEPCLNCGHEQPIVFDLEVYNAGAGQSGGMYISEDGIAPALRTRHPPGVCARYIVRRLTPTECARLQGFPDAWGVPEHKDDLSDEEYNFWLNVRNIYAAINGKAVRQYTRQQMLAWYSKLHTDSAEYKMWGNGIALPCALYVMQGIQDVLNGG